ncbi:MAG: hypothetical protein JW781_05835 [Deltaproteobacteria bacterium]|nr:hypothetical protein [Candidatus Anaeroferrophillacea bacterium]
MVIFARHNLIKDPPFNKIDLVSCRNLLIYLQPLPQKKVFSFFHFALNGKGFMFLGTSETVGDISGGFGPCNNRWKICRKNSGTSRTVMEILQPAVLHRKPFAAGGVEARRKPVLDGYLGAARNAMISA